MLEELEVLRDVATKLNDAGIQYMVSGSVAMNYYAQPRMTRDIDIVVMLEKGGVGKFVSLFDNDYYVDGETVKAEVERKGMFNLINNKYIIKIDFILLKDEAIYHESFRRRKRVAIDGFEMCIISPEDLIIQKLLWAKDSNSEMQMKDVRNIVRMVSDLDVAYLDKWLLKLGLKETFDNVGQIKS